MRHVAVAAAVAVTAIVVVFSLCKSSVSHRYLAAAIPLHRTLSGLLDTSSRTL